MTATYQHGCFASLVCVHVRGSREDMLKLRKFFKDVGLKPKKVIEDIGEVYICLHPLHEADIIYAWLRLKNKDKDEPNIPTGNEVRHH